MRNIGLFKKSLATVVLGASVAAMVAFTAETNDPWPVPAEFEKMKNPVKSNAESIAIGKELFAKHCKSCHGKFGEGDGPKASELKTDCGDFTSDKFKAQSDGAIFYKTKKGRDEMPNFGKKMTDDEEIWHVVNFLRTLGK